MIAERSSRHRPVLDGADDRRALQLKRLHREGHAAVAKDSDEKRRDRL
jgi:hypothetical protein